MLYIAYNTTNREILAIEGSALECILYIEDHIGFTGLIDYEVAEIDSHLIDALLDYYE